MLYLTELQYLFEMTASMFNAEFKRFDILQTGWLNSSAMCSVKTLSGHCVLLK